MTIFISTLDIAAIDVRFVFINNNLRFIVVMFSLRKYYSYARLLPGDKSRGSHFYHSKICEVIQQSLGPSEGVGAKRRPGQWEGSEEAAKRDKHEIRLLITARVSMHGLGLRALPEPCCIMSHRAARKRCFDLQLTGYRPPWNTDKPNLDYNGYGMLGIRTCLLDVVVGKKCRKVSLIHRVFL